MGDRESEEGLGSIILAEGLIVWAFAKGLTKLSITGFRIWVLDFLVDSKFSRVRFNVWGLIV